jgi:hypothetical protein
MYGVISTVPAPVEMYDTIHTELGKRVGFIDGLLVHVGRATTDGFEVLEVWESKEQYDRSNTEVLFPLLRELGGDQPQPSIEQTIEAFDVRGIILPGSNVYI